MANPEKYEFTSDNPHLIFPVGVLGSVPLNFMRNVADQYGTAYFSSLEALEYVLDGKDSQDVKPKMRSAWDDVGEIISECVEDALEEGSDVALDSFCHTPWLRSKMLDVAEKYGAVTVALTMTTLHQKSRERVAQWSESEMLGAPTDRWPHHPNEVTLEMMHKLEGPDQEGIDYAFLIDGGRKVPKLARSFNFLMSYHGIAYPVE